MKPILSILVPVYNTERFLSTCLDSVVSQTLKDIEIICVEDASIDYSKIILERYAKKDSRIRIIWHEKNAGLVKTRKDAVLSAKGKYIMFLDSDDALFPNACEIAYKAIENNKTDAVQFGVQHIDFQGKCITADPAFQIENSNRHEDDNWLYLYDKGLIKSWMIWNKIYNAELCKKAFGQMEDDYLVLAEDAYFLFAFGYYAKSLSLIKDVLYKYRQGSGIWSSGIQEKISLEKYKMLLTGKRAVDGIIRFYETKSDAKKYEPILQKHVKELFLRQAIIWWDDLLQDTDKVAGMQLFTEMWGNKYFDSAMLCMAEHVKYRIRVLQNDKACLQNIINDLQNDKACLQNIINNLQDELTAIKESRGHRVLRKYYFLRDTIRKYLKVF